MRLAGAFRRLIAIESFTDERSTPPTRPPAPEAGARWGRPAAFEIGEAPQPSPQASLTISWLHETRRLEGVESHRQYARTAALPDQPVTAEAIRSVTFCLGERQVRRESRKISGRVTSVMPVIETIRDYVRLDLPIGLAGERGEPHPPETPPREEPDYG